VVPVTDVVCIAALPSFAKLLMTIPFSPALMVSGLSLMAMDCVAMPLWLPSDIASL